MTKFAIDLNKFKKIHEDDHVAHLKHYEGHEFRIAKKKLSSKLKEQISKLPMAKMSPEPVQAFAKGGEAKDAKESVDIATDPNAVQMPDPAQLQAPPPPAPVPAPEPFNLEGQFGTGAPIQQSPPSAVSPAADVGPPAPPTQPLPTEAQPQAPVSAQPSPQPYQPGMEDASAPKPSAPTQPQPQTAEDWYNILQNDHQNYIKEMATRRIEPETYKSLFGKKDTVGKIGSIFGLLLGGMGAGQTGGPNPVMAMWDRQIANDLEAQKASSSNAQNFLRIAQQGKLDKAHIAHLAITDAQSAYEFAKIQANTAAFDAIAKDVAKLPPGSPQQKNAQNQLALIGQYLDTSHAQAMTQIAAKKAYQDALVGNANQSDPATQLRMKQVQGFITPAQYEQGNKELAQSQEITSLHKDLQKSFQDLDSKILAGKLSPEDRNSAINAFAGRLAKLSEGRFNMEESKQQIAAIMPAAFESAQTRANKLQRLHSLLEGQIHTPTLDGLGIKIARPEPMQQQPQTKTYNGVTYMRGPNGQAIPVK